MFLLVRSFLGINITPVHSQFKVLGSFSVKKSVYLKLKFLGRKSSWNKFSSLLCLIAVRSWKFCFMLVELSVTRPFFNYCWSHSTLCTQYFEGPEKEEANYCMVIKMPFNLEKGFVFQHPLEVSSYLLTPWIFSCLFFFLVRSDLSFFSISLQK